MGKADRWAQLARTRATQGICRRLWDEVDRDDSRIWCLSGPMGVGHNLKRPKPIIRGRAVSGIGCHRGLTEGFEPKVGNAPFIGEHVANLPKAAAPNVSGTRGHGWPEALDRPVAGRLGLVMWVSGTPQIKRRGASVIGSQHLYELVRESLAEAGERTAEEALREARRAGLGRSWSPSKAWLEGPRVRIVPATDLFVSYTEGAAWGTSKSDRGLTTGRVLARAYERCDLEHVASGSVPGIARLEDIAKQEAAAGGEPLSWTLRVRGGMQRSVQWHPGDRGFAEGYIDPGRGFRAPAARGRWGGGCARHRVGDLTLFVGYVRYEVDNDRTDTGELRNCDVERARLGNEGSSRGVPVLWRPSYAAPGRRAQREWAERVELDIGGWHAVALLG